MAVTASVTAPTTKAPISVALGRLPMISLHSVFRAARQEAAHLEVRRVREEVPRRAVRDAGPRLRIEEDAVVPDREDARQLVRHDDDGRAEAVAKFEDEVIEEPGGYRVEPRRRLVEEDHLRVESDRPRHARSLLHAAADFGRVVLLEALQADEGELQGGDLADLGRAEVRVLLERQADVLGEGHRAPQGAALVEDPHAAHDPRTFLGREALAAVEDLAPGGLLEADQVAEDGALPGAAAAH